MCASGMFRLGTRSLVSSPLRTPRFVALDGLRAVGALGVMLTHVGFNSGFSINERLGALVGRLDVGVALFFVVSGFLLFRPHVAAHLTGQARQSLRAYLVRRAARILPVLWIAVAATWILVRKDEDPGMYLAHATLTQIYFEDHHLYGLTQMWSLSTEVAYYLVLPLLAWILCRRRQGRDWVSHVVPILLALCIVSPIWMYVSTAQGHGLARLWLPGFIGWFSAGMLLAIWFETRRLDVVRVSRLSELAEHPGTAWSLAGALFVLSASRIAGPLDLSEPSALEAASKNLLYLLIGALVVLPCVPRQTSRSWGLSLLSGRLGRFLGDISYGFFAYHVIVLVLVERWLGLTSFDGEFTKRLVPTTILSVVVASISFYALEKPLMARVRGSRGRAVPIVRDGQREEPLSLEQQGTNQLQRHH